MDGDHDEHPDGRMGLRERRPAASTSLDPRARLLEVRARGSSDVLATGRRSLEPIRPSGCSSWSPSKRRPPLGEGPWWRSCPNLLQRPGSSQSAGRESLIFRASSRGRSRRGAPLQQIWTRSRPGSSQKPHSPHRAKRLAPRRTGTGRRFGSRPGGKDMMLFWSAFEYNPIRGAGIFRPGPADPCRRGAPHPGSQFRGNSLLRQSDQPRAP